MKKQEQFKDEAAAKDAAKAMSNTRHGYASVVLSKGTYYVENEPSVIRSWEKLIAEYEEGEEIKRD